MNFDEAFNLANAMKGEGWQIAGIEARGDGRYRVVASFIAGTSQFVDKFHNYEDFEACPIVQSRHAVLATKGNGKKTPA